MKLILYHSKRRIRGVFAVQHCNGSPKAINTLSGLMNLIYVRGIESPCCSNRHCSGYIVRVYNIEEARLRAGCFSKKGDKRAFQNIWRNIKVWVPHFVTHQRTFRSWPPYVFFVLYDYYNQRHSYQSSFGQTYLIIASDVFKSKELLN